MLSQPNSFRMDKKKKLKKKDLGYILRVSRISRLDVSNKKKNSE